MMALLPATLALAISAAPAGTVAFIDLDTTMIGMASQVNQALTEAAAKQKLSVFSIDEIRARLGPKRYNELIKCAGKPACVAQALAELTELSRVISGSLAIDEKNYVLRLSLIDVRSGSLIAAVDRSILIASRRFQRDVRELAGPLLKGEQEEHGTLIVKTNARGAQVTVNGEGIGPAPVTLKLKPGKHEVKVERNKYLPVTRLVDLEPNQTFTADIRMILKPGEQVEEDLPALVATAPDAAEKPGLHLRPATIVVAGLGIVAAGIGTVFGIQSSSAEKRLLASYNQKTDTYGGTRAEAIGAQDNATIANISFAVAGAALVATGVLIFFDINAAGAPLEVAPVVGPAGGGVLIGGHF